MDSKLVQLYINVNEAGEVVTSYYGENIVPTEDFDFFFLETEEVAVNAVSDYKVQLNGMKKELVMKSAI